MEGKSKIPKKEIQIKIKISNPNKALFHDLINKFEKE